MEEQKSAKKGISGFYTAIIFFLLGVICGFFIAPAKRGIDVICGNENELYNEYNDKTAGNIK